MVNKWLITTIFFAALSAFLGFVLLGATGKINDFGIECDEQINAAHSCFTNVCAPLFEEYNNPQDGMSWYSATDFLCRCEINNETIKEVKMFN